jgi:hypothetical protein
VHKEITTMKRNLGNLDRSLRVAGALLMLTCAWLAPLPLALRLAGLAASGVYLLFTALAGSCLGYTLMGRSSCPVRTGP